VDNVGLVCIILGADNENPTEFTIDDVIRTGADVSNFGPAWPPVGPSEDDDGVNDGLEVTFGTDPNNPADTPALPATDYRGVAILGAFLVLAGVVIAFRKKLLPRRAA
jgi:hypothetical protein